MKKQLLLFTICLFSFLTYAQTYPGKIRGFVLEDGTEIPIAFANVVVKGLNYGAVTNSEGYFQINDVEPGSYTI